MWLTRNITCGIHLVYRKFEKRNEKKITGFEKRNETKQTETKKTEKIQKRNPKTINEKSTFLSLAK
jgi:hypothetical protein